MSRTRKRLMEEIENVLVTTHGASLVEAREMARQVVYYIEMNEELINNHFAYLNME